MLMFQFEYLNKQKMSGQVQFLSLLADFFSALPHEYTYALEPRNPNYLNKLYFDFLNRHNLYHVFLEGYYMPPIVELYHLYKNYIKEFTAIRLHGAGRDEVEKETKEVWNRIVLPQDNELAHIIEMIKELNSRRIKIFINVNNHYEGSSPLTIKKITGLLHKRDNN
jgi:uncharacterized protein YecE (DUF72 family)